MHADPARRLSTLNRRAAMWGALALILVAPALAMRFTGEVRWGPEDFAAAALLLGGAGLGVELAIRFLDSKRARAIACAAVAGAVLLLWAEAAVGLF
jgi:hypothetical protein